jgi:hypothetical protein
MKWKGRRQSKNVEIRDTPEPFQDGDILFETGKVYRKGSKDDKTFSESDVKVAKELGKHHRNKTTPTPTPRPKMTQVTPGKWTTK